MREFSHLVQLPHSKQEKSFPLGEDPPNDECSRQFTGQEDEPNSHRGLSLFEMREFGHLIRPPENVLSPELYDHKEWCPTCKVQGECDVSVYL